jgi:hypothetical protein
MFGDMLVWIDEKSEFLSLVQIQHLGMGMNNIININIITMSGQQTDSTWRIDSHKRSEHLAVIPQNQTSG